MIARLLGWSHQSLTAVARCAAGAGWVVGAGRVTVAVACWALATTSWLVADGWFGAVLSAGVGFGLLTQIIRSHLSPVVGPTTGDVPAAVDAYLWLLLWVAAILSALNGEPDLGPLFIVSQAVLDDDEDRGEPAVVRAGRAVRRWLTNPTPSPIGAVP